MSARKNPTIIIPALLAFLALAPFSGCEKYVLPEITLAADTLNFAAREDSLGVFIETNVITTAKAESSDNWVWANPQWFDADTLVVIHVRENEATSSRTATIPIQSEAIVKNLVIIQEGAEPEPEPEPEEE